MAAIWKHILDSIVVLDGKSFAGLQVFGARSGAIEAFGYLTLDEAMGSSGLWVRELASASVGTLEVENRLDTPVLLVAGEELVGAKQNRVLNVSLMVGGKSTMRVPVSCVEAGRWAGSAIFKTEGTLSHGRLRRQIHAQTCNSYRLSGTPVSDQGAVWEEVSRKLGAVHSSSRSASLHQAYEDHRSKLREAVDALPPGPEWQGAAFVVGGRLVSIFLFDHPATLRKLWPKLIQSHALDLLEEQPGSPIDREAVEAMLRSLAEPTEETFKSPGLGEDVRMIAPGAVGTSLVVDGKPTYAEISFENGFALE